MIPLRFTAAESLRPPRRRLAVVAWLALALTAASLIPAQSVRMRPVLISTPRVSYPSVTAAIQSKGGQVTHQFKYVDGLAALIPDAALEDIRTLAGPLALDADIMIPPPRPAPSIRPGLGGAAAVDATPLTGKPPAAPLRSINNTETRIEELHALGFTGAGKTIAVIDSGLRIAYKAIAGSAIGGIDFVDDGAPGPAGDSTADWKKNANEGHGTFVAGLIVNNQFFAIDGALKQAFLRYAPSAISGDKIALVGTAPKANVYMVRVFGQAGAAKSTILTAIEHVIDQRLEYDATGGRSGVHIDVANLSLGAGTTIAGGDLLDLSLEAMLSAGIVPVASVGNTGPSTLTVATPGSSRAAITVGGASFAVNERIIHETSFGAGSKEYFPGIGGVARPFNGTQIAWFSSRGPTADGRIDPDVVASSVGNIGQGFCPDQLADSCAKRISIIGGTSFAAPIVSGIAATLAQAVPAATAIQIRNAIIQTSKSNTIANHFDVHDRGQGFPDALAAYHLLLTESVPDVLPSDVPPQELVRNTIESNTGLTVASGFVTRNFSDLKPGQRAEILYEVLQQTERVIVTVRNVRMKGPQNALLGADRLFVYGHSAKTSSIGATGDYVIPGATLHNGDGERVFILTKPDTGILRVTLNPDTLNAGLVDAVVTIESLFETWPQPTHQGVIAEGAALKFAVNIPPGSPVAHFLLTWQHDWAHYPVADLDMYVCSPSIPDVTATCIASGLRDGASLAGPERATVVNPAAGTWHVVVRGFRIPTGTDPFQLRVSTTP